MTNEEQIEKILCKKGELLPTEIFLWETHSYYVARHCPQHFNPEKYNWEEHSWAVAESCPQHFNTELYNWEKFSHYVAQYSPNKIDIKKYNWKINSAALLFYHPQHKYLKHCICNTKTIESLNNLIENYNNLIWKKYLGEIDHLLNPTKREVLLNKIAKEIKISKI